MSEQAVVVSEMDVRHLALIRRNVEEFIRTAGRRFLSPGLRLVLDIAPHDQAGARPHFPPEVVVETLDIDPAAGATYTGDLCGFSPQVPSARYDMIVCTEVLEHTLQPFDAVREIRRMLKPGGILALSTPFNFRIHGPLPDCWRFTVHGIKALLRDFEAVEIQELQTPGRDLMPIHYTAIARKPL
ncbi:MAG TPA: methyltransferase domain-containing protein [Bryobacteraceae bacterium]|nr:methyltransferase domain-containing protein [Bryobacteraceae bacterium]